MGAGVGFVSALALEAALAALWKWWRGRRGSPTEAALQLRQDRQPRQLKLYHSFPFRSGRCAWLIKELEVDEYVETIPVALHGPQAKDLLQYRDVHPHGTLPALVLEDGFVLLESAAICLYLADVFQDSDGNSLLPEDHNTAEYYNFISYATSTFDQILEPLYMQLTHTPEDQRNQTLVDSMMRKFHICASVVATFLSNRQYICGDKFTAADCVIGYNIWWASVIQGGLLLQDYPVLNEYLTRLKSRRAFEATFKGKKPVKPSGGSL